MKYSRILKGTVGLMLFGLIAGCQSEEIWEGTEKEEVLQDRIVLALSDAGGERLTRAATEGNYQTPTDVEKEVVHFDVFVVDAAENVAYYERVSAPQTGSKVALKQAKSKFGAKVSYSIYVVANCTEMSSADFAKITTLTQLKQVSVVTENIHVTGMEPPTVTDVPHTFMMDGHSQPEVLNDEDLRTNKEVSITLRRAAAKITILLRPGSHASFLPLTNDQETSGHVQRRVMNFANKTSVLQPDDEDSYDNLPLYSNEGYSTVGVEQEGQSEGVAANMVAITVYSYSNNWATKPLLTNESHLIVRIPLSYKSDESTEAKVETENYYKIPLSGNHTDVNMNSRLKRNHSYFTTITVDNLGAKNPEEPVTLKPAFFKVQDWETETIEIGGSGQAHPRYLALSMDTLRINNASTDNSVIFASSTEISTVTVDRVYYINKFGVETSVTNHGVKVSTEPGLNGHVIVNSQLSANSLSVRYIELTITNEDGEKQSLVVEQYPLEYVTNTQGWYSYRDDFDNGSGTPTTYIEKGTSPYRIGARWNNGSWTYSYNAGSSSDFFASKVVTAYSASGNNQGKSTINYYSWYRQSGWSGYVESNTVVNGSNVLGNNGGNARMYHVQITSTPEGVDYVLGLPKMNDKGYTADDTFASGNSKVVSPSFMIASQLGAVMSAGSVEQAASHCAQYVEVTNRGNKTDNKDVVAYHDWRLPTKAEIEVILKYQQNSDAIDEVLTWRSYWSASGLVTNPSPSSSSSQAIRCIRDAYRDGESK